MKPSKSHLVLAVAAILLVLMWLLLPRQPTQSPSAPQSNTVASPQPAAGASPAFAPAPTAPHKVTDTTSAAGVDATPQHMPRVQDSVFYSDWKRPIMFYGKVVDEKGSPVSEANVHFSWTDTSPSGRSQAATRTDTNGLLELSGVTGRSLLVDVGKTGYYSSRRDKTDFDYSPNFSLDPHHPDPDNPVVFHLRRKGAGTDLITSDYGIKHKLGVQAPLDGTTVSVDLLSRKMGQGGQLEISQRKPEYLQARDGEAWTFQMAIPSGGFIEQDQEFPFEAPEMGYQPVIAFQFNKGQTNWARAVKRSYYISFGQPPRYGWLTLETQIGMEGARLQYAINPTGSRYLEPR